MVHKIISIGNAGYNFMFVRRKIHSTKWGSGNTTTYLAEWNFESKNGIISETSPKVFDYFTSLPPDFKNILTSLEVNYFVTIKSN